MTRRVSLTGALLWVLLMGSILGVLMLFTQATTGL